VRGFPTRQVLIAYTDGLAESRDSEGRMLDIRALAASIDTWEPEEAIKEVERAFSDHVAGRVQDDVTVLAFKRTSE
jgi:serine phosphatase RsbU (regulator of sigma subunit)